MNDTVKDLKTKIQATEGTPVDQQNLVYSGKFLHNGSAVTAYNFKKSATIQLMTTVRNRFG